jgi:histidinol dehydrogenase
MSHEAEAMAEERRRKKESAAFVQAREAVRSKGEEALKELTGQLQELKKKAVEELKDL